ncbi:MAG: bifunctional diaminohydroxyphosphoribosylaminopyrimidine deaminase/5-amino-6-(5-phosphoribosylamino)uracil reductase RibD [Muribaculaceae bacterium]|nr:bifunctional diaminohydroxyphosphoribosylaminopyrimidine deaminase/5-amino-6-(5-phosphoribosylamino)uracil reductase RibD [Muribaculaceae bacterium]
MRDSARDLLYMRRALELAAHGRAGASPNPMVGAVIVSEDRIIGQGWHRRCGGSHAEVNAMRSVRECDRHLLSRSTMYVTLEPCAHYGKTPPCATMLATSEIKRVVIGIRDIFSKVNGKGISILQEAGKEVCILGEKYPEIRRECESLNAHFITAHRLHRPFITLKWAQSRDGFMDVRRTAVHPGALKLSTPLSLTAMHRYRATHDAVVAGAVTVMSDRPSLTLRYFGGYTPQPVILQGHTHKADVHEGWLSISPEVSHDLPKLLKALYDRNIISVLVEGGGEVLNSFINAGLWDMARVEVAQVHTGEDGRCKAPEVTGVPAKEVSYGGNKVWIYVNNPLVDVKNI